MRVPERGQFIWLDFDPQAGREQSGRRPALVLSPSSYNRAAGLVLVCPVKSKAKGYPFEVGIEAGLSVQGVVLSDHVRSLDWQVRRADFICTAPAALIDEVSGKLAALIGEPD